MKISLFRIGYHSIKKSLLLLLTLVLVISFIPKQSVSAQSLVLDEPQLVTDYRVYDILFDGDYAYIGGEFKTIGYLLRENGFVSDTVNGTFDFSWPEIKGGRVTTIVPDGVGGWYIGGRFTSVGGYTRNRLAHILADKSVDQNWNPDSNDWINSITVSGTDIYVGGWFSSIGGQARNRIAKLNNTTGAADSNWNPDADGTVSVISVSGTDVYTIGSFTNIGGQARNRIAKLNNTTGEADINWNPNPNNSVLALAVSGSDIYVGGYFTSIGGQTRNRIAKLNNTTGEADLTWNPNANNRVTAIYISGTDIYTGGYFTSIGGQTRNRIAKLNNTTGSADLTWNPNSNGGIESITIEGSDIYVGGYFSSIGGQARKSLAKLNNTTGAVNVSWNPISYGPGYYPIVAANSQYVFIGSDLFLMDDAVARNYLARINLITGQIDPDWDPSPNNLVLTIKVSGDNLYLGGSFTSIGGQTRNRLAKINKNTGTVDATWNPSANSTIQGITLSGSDVYVGGAFSNVGGQTRNRIAKLNNTTGAADTLWNPNANDQVNSIVVSETDVYAGGWFTSIGGQARNRIAKVNNTTGAADLSWDASVNNPTIYMWINDMGLSGSDLFVGGFFHSIGGSLQKGAAKINTETAAIDSNWNLQLTGNYDTIYALQVLESSVIVGGQFSSLGGETRNDCAKVDIITATPDQYFNQSPSMVSSIAIEGRRYWYATEYYAPYLRTYTLESTPPTLSLNTLVNSQLSDSTPTLTGSATDTHAAVVDVEFQIDSTDGIWSNCTADDAIFNEQTETFSCTPLSPLQEGSHTMYVRAKDSNDNITPIGSYVVKTFTIDTISPSLAITYIDYYKVTPTRWLLNRRPLFEGLSEANSTIQVQVLGSNISNSITSDTNGYWLWKSSTDLPLGTHQVQFTSTDGAGNTSSASVILVVMLSFNNTPEEDTIIEEDLPDNTPEEEEDTTTEDPPIETDSTITVLQFLDKDGNPMASALVTIEGTDYYTDTEGKIRVPGLEINKKYKIKVEYNGIKYESEVLGASDLKDTVVVKITSNEIVKENTWTKILIYGGVSIFVIGIIILLSKKAKLSNTR